MCSLEHREPLLLNGGVLASKFRLGAIMQAAPLLLQALSNLVYSLRGITPGGGKDLSNLTSEDRRISHFLDLASWVVKGMAIVDGSVTVAKCHSQTKVPSK